MQDESSALPLFAYQFCTQTNSPFVAQYTQQLQKIPAARKCMRLEQEVDWQNMLQSIEEEKRLLHTQKQAATVQTFIQSLGEQWISTFENDNYQIRARYH